jgi:beta-xylosidase
MIEAAKFWNEPNNQSHWDLAVDPGWVKYGEMVKLASAAVHAESSRLTRVLGGMSPIDPAFIRTLNAQGVLDTMDAVAVHGFPLDWNPWQIDQWPDRIADIQAVTHLPVWVTQVGVSSFGAEEVQEFGLKRTAELLPKAWPSATRHREAEGSSQNRHYHMGLLREDGTPKLACKRFAEYAPAMGICQWFHFGDHRLEHAVHWLKKLGVTKLRTGLSWADSLRPGADAWFDRQMAALDDFDLTVTFCFTPEHRGIEPHHTSAPQVPEEYAAFCARMVRRYGGTNVTAIGKPQIAAVA